jgi:type I restriction enzyme S subunit
MQTDCFADAIPEWPRGPVSSLAVVSPRYPMKKGQEYPFVEMASVGEDFAGILQFATRALEGSGLSRFKVGDTLFAKITPCPQNGKVAFVDSIPGELGLGSTEFIVLSPRPDTAPRFLYHLACSHDVRGRAAARMEGSTGRQRVPDEVFTKRLLVPLPDPDEQAAIARILDAVDTALERTRAAVERARELRKSLIHELLSRGSAREEQRNSAAGFIPRSWACEELGKYLADGPTNGVYRPESDYAFHGTRIIRIDDFEDGYIKNIEELRRVVVEPMIQARYAVTEDDVVINRVNSLSHIGKSVLVPCLNEPTIFESNMMRVRCGPGLRPAFLNLVLCSDIARRHWLARAKPAVNQASVNQRDARELPLPIPPTMDEQDEIAAVVSASQRQIDLLNGVGAAQQQLKKSLMHDLLTGRVRVRDTSKMVAS